MIIGLRAGHSPNCLGAVGLRNEWECMNTLYGFVERVLQANGHTVINCNSTSNTQNGELWEGTNKANAQRLDLFISLHMNSYNGTAHGVEAWTWGEGSRANAVAERLVNNFEGLGLFNRGVKYNSKYFEMRNINAPNIIFETMFCDSEKDISIWTPTPYENMAQLIANAIDTNIPKEYQAPAVAPQEQAKEVYYRVVVSSCKDRAEAEATRQEAISKGFPDAFLVAFEK